MRIYIYNQRIQSKQEQNDYFLEEIISQWL